ncbi:MAG: methylcrotonoyl-CoA carboxylase, partial [Chloroflexi bacterium]|nr:methylcrotonoyl-CoA carboxylase [Chloroflexota bacterium]
METIESQIDVNDPQFKENAAHHRLLAEELRERLKIARQGGGVKYQARQREQGKLFVRDRIDKLLDQGSAFLELSPLAAFELYHNEAPCAGVVTGIGR